MPITATVPAGTLELVMEVTNPDGVAAGNMFFIGSNASPETGPSYLSAADCGITDPTPTQTLVSRTCTSCLTWMALARVVTSRHLTATTHAYRYTNSLAYRHTDSPAYSYAESDTEATANAASSPLRNFAGGDNFPRSH